ncbi:MAG: CHAT domain-containing protein [Candidatus Polarisedimenticolia bacterium]
MFPLIARFIHGCLAAPLLMLVLTMGGEIPFEDDGLFPVAEMCDRLLALDRDSTEAAFLLRDLTARESGAGTHSQVVLHDLHSCAGKLQKDARLGQARAVLETELELGRRQGVFGPMDEARLLSAIGDIALSLSDLAAAHTAHERSLELRREALPADDPLIAVSLNGLGRTAFEEWDLPRARSLHEQALAILKRREPRSLQVAETLRNIGYVVRLDKTHEAAKPYYTEAFALVESLAPDTMDHAASLYGICIVTPAPANREKCRLALDLARRLAPDSLERSHYETSMGNMTEDLEEQGRYYSKALELRERWVPGSVWVARALNNLANWNRNRGDLAAARQCLKRALAITQRVQPKGLDIATSLNTLGSVLVDIGDLIDAKEAYSRLLELERADSLNYTTGEAPLGGLGNVAYEQGDYEAALRYHEEALSLKQQRGVQGETLARSFNNLALIQIGRGDLRAAEEATRRGLDIRILVAVRSINIVKSLNTLAAIFFEKGDLGQAKENARRALEMGEEVAPGSLSIATTLTRLGMIASAEGDRPEARRRYLQALEIRERLAPSSTSLAESLANVGELEADPGRAAGWLERAWSLVRQHADEVVGDEAMQAFEQGHISYATSLIQARITLGDSRAAFETLEEARALALLDSLKERGLGSMGIDADLWRDYKASEAELHRVGQKLASAGADEGRAGMDQRKLAKEDPAGKEKLARARARREELADLYTRRRMDMQGRLSQVRQSSPRWDEPMAVDEARRALPSDGLLLSFAVGPERTAVLVVSPRPDDPVEGYIVDAGEQQLAERIHSLRTSLRETANPLKVLAAEASSRVKAEGRELFERLFPPAVRAEIQETHRLVLSPDGPLWDLPFACLSPDETEKATWLGLTHSLTYIQSLSSLAAQQRMAAGRPSAAGSVLVVGDPLFSRPGYPAPGGNDPSSERHFLFQDGHPPDRLPGTRQEAREVARLYGAKPLLGEQATEPAVRGRLPEARIIHLATHGFFNPHLPMSSGVLLSVPALSPSDKEQTRDDGCLQAWEFVGELTLKADLAVLSACETGTGRKVRGEGLVGMARALQMAGASAVLASQWRIDDQKTSRLMVSFHRALISGLPKDVALQRAVREGLDDPGNRAPWWWAGFLMFGDPKAVDSLR